jgi:hypothetical protein
MHETTPIIALPQPLHAFILLVLGNPAVQAELGAVLEARAFVAKAQEIAARHDVALDPDELLAVLRPDPLGLGRFAPAPIELAGWPGAGWLPARSIPGGLEPAFDWLWFGPDKLTAPFHEDDVRRASALPLNSLVRTRLSLGAMVAGAEDAKSPPLRGLIFHMSRCGSTLLVKMLGACPETAVTSEPEPLDAVLRWIAAAAPGEEIAGLAIRAMIAALGRQGGGTALAHVIKLEVWHSLFLSELRAALPEVNWVFLHRDPVEVLVSQMAMPSIHIVQGALDDARLGIDGEAAESHMAYAAQVLGRCTAAAADGFALGGGLVLAYAELRRGGAEAAVRHFGLPLDEAARATLAAAGSTDAKSPGQPFVDDRARKRAEASDELRAAAAEWMAPAYDRVVQLDR